MRHAVIRFEFDRDDNQSSIFDYKLTESSTQECISPMRLASGYGLVSTGRRFPYDPLRTSRRMV